MTALKTIPAFALILLGIAASAAEIDGAPLETYSVLGRPTFLESRVQGKYELRCERYSSPDNCVGVMGAADFNKLKNRSVTTDQLVVGSDGELAALKTALGLNAGLGDTWLFQFARASVPLEYPAALIEALFDTTVNVSGAQKTRASLSVLLSKGGRLRLTEQIRFETNAWRYSNLLFYEVRVGDEVRVIPLEASKLLVTL